MEKKKKRKPTLIEYTTYGVSLMLGFAAGFGGVYCLDRMSQKLDRKSLIIVLVLYLVSIFVFYFLQLMVHEAGHLVMGKATGYEFVSYRIGSLTWIKEDGRLKVKRFNLAGTAGQCLMTYPEDKELEKAPFFWYHFGGVFFNFISALIGGSAFLIVKASPVRYFILLFAIVSLFLGLLNFIPSKAMGVPNDGYNIWLMKKHPEIKKLILQNLIVNAMQYQGRRIKDIDDRFFEGGDPDGDIFQAAVSIMGATRELDRHDFDSAMELYQQLCDNEKLIDLYKNECKCELLFTKIITGAPKDEVEELYTKDLKKYVMLTESFYITRKRLLYAYYLITENDKKSADKEYDLAVKMKKSYPAKGEYDSEMALIEFIKDNYNGEPDEDKSDNEKTEEQ